MPTKVFIQPEGAKHVFRRPGTAFSLDNIVERPQRLRAVNCGLAAGLARLEALQPLIKPEQQQEQQQDQSDDLIKALKGLALGTPALAPSSSAQPSIVFSAPASSGLIRSKAVEFVHHPPSDDPEEVRYLDSLVSWVKTCEGKWAAGESEIPAELPQLDLYRASPSDASVRPLSRRRPTADLHRVLTCAVCRASLAAVEGALSTTIQAVDAVVADSQAQASTSADVSSSSAATAFCAIRPPGHHCGEDNPMGFCFVNNVAVGAAHGASTSAHAL
jgi:histone deacetylase HOS3